MDLNFAAIQSNHRPLLLWAVKVTSNAERSSPALRYAAELIMLDKQMVEISSRIKDPFYAAKPD